MIFILIYLLPQRLKDIKDSQSSYFIKIK